MAAADALKAKAAAAKDKAKGDKPPAKTNIILDVKGECECDDEGGCARCVRACPRVALRVLLALRDVWRALLALAAGWGEETDMDELEKCVREIEMDGLLWVRNCCGCSHATRGTRTCLPCECTLCRALRPRHTFYVFGAVSVGGNQPEGRRRKNNYSKLT